LNNYAKKGVIIMHPGPANRNVEISSELLDSSVGQTILEQARNGVFVRMAVLEKILAKEGAYAS
jgi:aspartate carbamoyltransferase catalytic subunit